MKRFLIMTILILSVALSLSAVDFTIGPKIAFGDYGYRGSDWSDFKTATGLKNMLSPSFVAGVFFNPQFSKLFGIQIEGVYTYTTLRYGDSANWIQEMYSAISVPIYVRLNFGSGPSGFYLLAGPRFDIYFETVKYKESLGFTDEYTFSDAGYNSFLIAIALGGGFSFPAGSGKMDIGLIYSTNLTRLVDDSDVFAQGIQIQIGYGFLL